MATQQQQDTLKKALEALLEPSALDNVISCAVPIDNSPNALQPRTCLLHVRFNEDKPQVEALARFLWKNCTNYALSRRRRAAFRKALIDASEADISSAADIVNVVRDVFIEFREKYPSRASEVGEVLAYCVALHYLNAAQMAAKVSLKTSPNMPVHGLDGIHAIFSNNALTMYFLESKLSKTAGDGAREYAKSIAAFLTDEKQYLREYELVGDLGNLDALEGGARELALQHFDVLGHPEIPRRERSVGVICYTEKKHFENKLPISDGDIDIHEKHFSKNFSADIAHHQSLVSKNLLKLKVPLEKCSVFFVAVPDVNLLRKSFYTAMGIPGSKASVSKTKKS